MDPKSLLVYHQDLGESARDAEEVEGGPSHDPGKLPEANHAIYAWRISSIDHNLNLY